MQRLLCGFAGCALALLLGAAAANAQDSVKIGIIMPYSGSSPTPRRKWITASSCI